MPPQLLETIASSDELDVGKTSVGMSGKAAAEETKTKEENAATVNERTTEDDKDVVITNLRFLQKQPEDSTTQAALPCVNFRRYENTTLRGKDESETRTPATTATSATPAPHVANVATHRDWFGKLAVRFQELHLRKWGNRPTQSEFVHQF